MLATFVVGSLSATIVLLSLMLVGSYSAKGPFWMMVTRWLSARHVAISLAGVSGAGSLGTAPTTYLFRLIRERTNSYELGLPPLVGLALSGALVLFMVRPKPPGDEPAGLVRADETR